MKDTDTTTVYRRAGLFLLAACLVAYAFFYQGGGWNQNSRFALVRAIVEKGTLRIDETGRFEGQWVTGDYARCGRHVCSDKAPGLALLAAPVVAAARPFVAAPASRAGTATLSYVATLALAAIPTALAVLLLLRIAVALGAGGGGALFCAAVFGLATPAWAYATLLFGHALATFCLVAAFAAAVALREERGGRRDLLLAGAGGLAAGWGTITEYPTAIPAAIVFALAVAHAWPGGWPRRARVAGAMAAGGLAALAVLLAYNQAAFGAPLSVGYAHLEGFGGMKTGFLGVTYPKAHVLYELTLGRFRGIFVVAPALLAAPLGFALLGRRATTWAAAAIAVYYLLFCASYHYWHGGSSWGPRHLAPALPFLALALAPLWTRGTAALRAPLAALALAGALITLMAVSTTAQPPETVKRPLGALVWPAFRAGELSLNHQAYVENWVAKRRDPVAHAWNLGEKLGLSGKASLLPLLAAWAALGGGLALAAKRRPRR